MLQAEQDYNMESTLNRCELTNPTIDISEALVSTGVLTRDQMALVMDQKRFSQNIPISQLIKSLQIADETTINRMIASVLGSSKKVIEGYKLQEAQIDAIKTYDYNLTKAVSFERKQVVVEWKEEEISIIASDLFDVKGFIKTEQFYKGIGFKKINFLVVPHLDLVIAHNKVYAKTNSYKEKVMEFVENRDSLQENLRTLNKLIIEQGVIEGASDIFIQENKKEPFSYIYFRIDRVKQYRYCFPTNIMQKIVQFLKQESNMEAGKLMGHQDGSIALGILDNQHNVSIRLNSITTITGTQMAMRLQPEEQKRLDALGFEADDVNYIKNVLSKEKGIVLLTGVTGSGKTTTLHAMLNEFNVDEKNIITMEEPVEIRRRGLNQIEINREAGQGFRESIRAVLRQAPDILLVGEIRDMETAERAVEAANTGHMVFSTLHVGSVGAIEERLKELGVERTGLFMQNLSLAIYQELNPKKYGRKNALCYEITRSDIPRGIKKVRLDGDKKSAICNVIKPKPKGQTMNPKTKTPMREHITGIEINSGE
jgi:type II secretory ATPase GspE/PulE/Tfp pilus assembly ATPase PilB-like protein